MYGKYTLFYESSKNWEYYAQTVCTRPLLVGEGPGDEAKYVTEQCLVSAYMYM